MSLPQTETKAILDNYLPNTGTIGVVALLRDTNYFSAEVTCNSATDVITTQAAHLMITGSRVRVSTPPAVSGAALQSGTDYWIINTSTTEVKLARSLADAIAGTAVNFTANAVLGDGFSLAEQPVVYRDNSSYPWKFDPIGVLINKECSGNGYTRHSIASLGAAIDGADANGNARAQKETAWIQSATGAGYDFRFVVLLKGGSLTPGDVTGVQSLVGVLNSAAFVTPSTPYAINLRFVSQGLP